MTQNHRSLGKAGEELAAVTLQRQGYQILERNYTTPWGEIDLIANHQGVLVFIEVKARRSRTFGTAQEAITYEKQAKIYRVAEYYLKQHNIDSQEIRFDVVAINAAGQKMQVEIIPNALGI
jgi:putative endonuclease